MSAWRSRWSGEKFSSTAIHGWNVSDAFQLEAARLDDVDRVLGRVVDLRAERVADVAADEHVMAARLEHPPGQRRRRRLPLRAGDRDDAAAQPARGQLQLAHDRHARGARLGDRRLRGRHTGTQHDQIGAEQRLPPVPAEFELHAGVAQLRVLVDRLARVGERDRRAAPDEQLRRRDAAPRRADHDDPLARDGE